MKKSSKPLIIVVASLFVLFTIIILISQSIRLKYEELQREFAQLENRIKTEKNQSVTYKANYQMLTAEGIVKDFAIHDLGLVNNNNVSQQKISLSKEEVAKLSENVVNLNE